MSSKHKETCLTLSSFVIFLVIVCGQAGWCQEETERRTGLIFATPEELRGVPPAETPSSGDELPPRVDLSGDLPPPGNQGGQSSCVGWAVAYALKSYQEKVDEGLPIVTPAGKINPHRVFSPAFIYNQINRGRDGGSTYLDAFNVLERDGAATWKDMPYREKDYRSQPSQRAIRNARRYKIDYWSQVNTASTTEVKAHLHHGMPVLVSLSVDESFTRAKRGFIWRSPGGRDKGRHAALLIGYDDSRGAFKLINSWGRQWGDKGYGWIDYRHFRKVAKIGYVTKDRANGPSPEIINPDPPIPQPIRRRDKRAAVTITDVQFPVLDPYGQDPRYGEQDGLYFEGLLKIPPGMGKRNRVLVHFYFYAGGGRKGKPVRSLQPPVFSDVHGNAACVTRRYPIPRRGLYTDWYAWIPFGAIIPPEGFTSAAFVAEPVLFVDNFGIARGEPFIFEMELVE